MPFALTVSKSLTSVQWVRRCFEDFFWGFRNIRVGMVRLILVLTLTGGELLAAGESQIASSPESQKSWTQGEVVRAQLQMTHLLVSKVILFQLIDLDKELIDEPFKGGAIASEVTARHYHLLIAKKYFLSVLRSWQNLIDTVDFQSPSVYPSSRILYQRATEENIFLRENNFVYPILGQNEDKFKLFAPERIKLIQSLILSEDRLLDRLKKHPNQTSILVDGLREKEIIDNLNFFYAFASKDHRLQVSLLLFFTFHQNSDVVNYAISSLNRLQLYYDPLQYLEEQLAMGSLKPSSMDRKSAALAAFFGGAALIGPEVGGAALLATLGHYALTQYLVHLRPDSPGSTTHLLKGGLQLSTKAVKSLSEGAKRLIENYTESKSDYLNLEHTTSYGVPEWAEAYSSIRLIWTQDQIQQRLTEFLKSSFHKGTLKSGSIPSDFIEFILMSETRRFESTYFVDYRLFAMAKAAYATTLDRVKSIRLAHEIHGEKDPMDFYSQIYNFLWKRHSFYYLAGSPSVMRALISEGGNCVSSALIYAMIFSQLVDGSRFVLGVTFPPEHVRMVIIDQKDKRVLELDGDSPSTRSLGDYPNSIYSSKLLVFNLWALNKPKDPHFNEDNKSYSLKDFEIYRPKNQSKGSKDLTWINTDGIKLGFNYFGQIPHQDIISNESRSLMPNPPFAIANADNDKNQTELDQFEPVNGGMLRTVQRLRQHPETLSLDEIVEGIQSDFRDLPTIKAALNLLENRRPLDPQSLHSDQEIRRCFSNSCVAFEAILNLSPMPLKKDDFNTEKMSVIYFDQSQPLYSVLWRIPSADNKDTTLEVTLIAKDAKVFRILQNPQNGFWVLVGSVYTKLKNFGHGLKTQIFPEMKRLIDSDTGPGAASALGVNTKYKTIVEALRNIVSEMSLSRYLYSILFLMDNKALNHFEDLLHIPALLNVKLLIRDLNNSDVDIVQFPRAWYFDQKLFMEDNIRPLYAFQKMVYGFDTNLNNPGITATFLKALLPQSQFREGSDERLYLNGLLTSDQTMPLDGIVSIPGLSYDRTANNNFDTSIESSSSRYSEITLKGKYSNYRLILNHKENRTMPFLGWIYDDNLIFVKGRIIDSLLTRNTAFFNIWSKERGSLTLRRNKYIERHSIASRIVAPLTKERYKIKAKWSWLDTLFALHPFDIETESIREMASLLGVFHLLKPYRLSFPEIEIAECENTIPQGVKLPAISKDLCRPSGVGYGLYCLNQGGGSIRGESRLGRRCQPGSNVEIELKSSEPDASISDSIRRIPFEVYLGTYLSLYDLDTSEREFLRLIDNRAIEHLSRNREFYKTYWAPELNNLCSMIIRGQMYAQSTLRNQSCVNCARTSLSFSAFKVNVSDEHWEDLLKMKSVLEAMDLCRNELTRLNSGTL